MKLKATKEIEIQVSECGKYCNFDCKLRQYYADYPDCSLYGTIDYNKSNDPEVEIIRHPQCIKDFGGIK